MSNIHFYILIQKGYETTSTALTYSSFVLVNHPEEQQKLYEEIHSHFNAESDVIEFYNFTIG